MATATTTVRIQARGVLTLPKELRARVGIGAGDQVYLRERAGGIFIAPATESDPILEDAVQALEDLRDGRASPAFSNMREFETYAKLKRSKSRG